MNTLHALWRKGDMLLWMEGDAHVRRSRKRGLALYPNAASVDTVVEYLTPLLSVDLDTSREDTLWLPHDGVLNSWRVPVLVLGPAPGAVLLANLSTHPPTFLLADDTRVWSAVGRWVLALVARQRAVPHLTPDGDTSGWRAVLDDPADQRRLSLLAAALPQSGRDCDETTVTTARVAVLDFVKRAVDDYIGGISHGRTSEEKVPARWPEEARAWATALLRSETQLAGVGPRTRARLGADIERWSAPLRARDDAPFRTCFRLEPPQGTIKGSWRVDILAQAANDPSHLTTPVGEGVLADLGRAVRVFPELKRALAETRPSAVELDVEEAANFLRETSFLLEDGGFPVLIPGDRLMRTNEVQVALKVSPSSRSEKGGVGGFGLDAIVDYNWAVSLGGEALTVDEFRALAKAKVPLVQVRGQWVLLDSTQVERTLAALNHQPARPTLRKALAWAAREDIPAATVSLEGTLAALTDPGQLEPVPLPSELQATLRPYQERGFSWLSCLTSRGLGACLADDMGLGKTLQVLTLLMQRRGGIPSLLVCPTSLVGNWQREGTRFAPVLKIGIHHGAERRKETDFATWAAGFDVVITTYALAARDSELLVGVEWDALVLDEAQNIKNAMARQSQAVRGLKARCRVAMSGTPVENRLSDLWSIMDFVNPGLLGSRQAFRRRFSVPIERKGDTARATTLRSMVAPFVLRRLKTDPTVIADLPEKLEMKVYCPLTREQATLYQATVDDMMARIEDSDGIQRKGLVLSTMLRLKQICDHPALYLDDGSDLGEQRSGKLQRLVAMLEEVVLSGDRALVFTQFSSFGARLQRALQERLKVPVQFLSGETARKDRDAMVERFQSPEGAPIFVLSVKAGGVGLNLTTASHVFHYDRWWNPAVENQATDRAFRIGQRKNVQVHKFVCQGTLEEAIDALLESKLALAEQVVGTGEGWLSELDTSQLRKLFTLQADAVEDQA